MAGSAEERDVRRIKEDELPTVERLEAIDTVRLVVPAAALEPVRGFYGRTLELQEVEAAGVAVAYRVGQLEIHLHLAGPDDPPPMPSRRMVLQVAALSEVMARLRAEGFEFEVTHEMGSPHPNVVVLDPAGHRVSLREVREI